MSPLRYELVWHNKCFIDCGIYKFSQHYMVSHCMHWNVSLSAGEEQDWATDNLHPTCSQNFITEMAMTMMTFSVCATHLLPHQKICLGPIYYTSKFGADRVLTVKWRQGVVTASKDQIYLGSMNNPIKFAGEIKTIKSMHWDDFKCNEVMTSHHYIRHQIGNLTPS